MAAIAYITDPKMLEIHRLDRRKQVNFWRLSAQINFRDFQRGDLLFFLSKDKKSMRNGEKGIVGYGRADNFLEASPAVMWKRYGVANGYDGFALFKKALCKVARFHILPPKISSIYLKDVLYFQTPIYLSDYGMQINQNIESFCYIENNIVSSLLYENRYNLDSWSHQKGNDEMLLQELARYHLFQAQDIIKDIPVAEKQKRKAQRRGRKYLKQHHNLDILRDSTNTLYDFLDDQLRVYFIQDEKLDKRLYIGQKEYLYQQYESMKPVLYPLSFYLIDEQENIKNL